jgi:shikimate kinase
VGSQRHVVLVGATGSGKSTVGRLLAVRIGRRFRDNDVALAARGETAGTVSGDEAPHVEADLLLAQLEAPRPAVIAAAASVVDDPRVPSAVADAAVAVWLRGEPAVVTARARRGGYRPLVGDAVALRQLAVARADRYAAVADVTVDVTSSTPATIVDEVTAALARRVEAPPARPGSPVHPTRERRRRG